ncbi:MAG: hypothetical protein GF347_05540 [Candidatus Moranbacteria bacterium]|nr:hypothetical protein [Candidatus Moranbacteria bacterium]
MKFKKQKKILKYLGLLIIALAFYAVLKLFVLALFFKPFDRTIYVDNGSRTWAQNGSFRFPFKDLKEAIVFLKINPQFNKIIIREGLYEGAFGLPKGVALVGEGENVILQNPKENFLSLDSGGGKTYDHFSNAVLALKGENYVENIKIKKGFYGVYLFKDAAVELNNCLIDGAYEFGIYNHPFTLWEKKVIIRDSRIINSKKQGLYLNGGTFEIVNTTIRDNGEEGLDIHSGVDIKVVDSDISNNGEGGVEADLGYNRIDIRNCVISQNVASGIKLQSNREHSVVILKNNLITKNRDHGLECSIHRHTKKSYFTRAFSEDLEVIKIDNQIKNNNWEDDYENVGSRCKK